MVWFLAAGQSERKTDKNVLQSDSAGVERGNIDSGDRRADSGTDCPCGEDNRIL